MSKSGESNDSNRGNRIFSICQVPFFFCFFLKENSNLISHDLDQFASLWAGSNLNISPVFPRANNPSIGIEWNSKLTKSQLTAKYSQFW